MKLGGTGGCLQLGQCRLGARLRAFNSQSRLFPTEPLRLAFNLIRRTFNPPCISETGLSLAGAVWGSDRDPVTHTALHSPPGRAPMRLLWHLVQTEVVWRFTEDRTLVWKDKLVSSVLDKTLPCPPGHCPQHGLSVFSHQHLQAEKPRKRNGCSLWCHSRPSLSPGPEHPRQNCPIRRASLLIHSCPPFQKA